MTTLVATVGFDEKFVIRAIMRHVDSLEKVYLITATPVEERVRKAVRLIEEFINKILKEPDKEIKLEVVETDLRDFFGAIAELRKKCFEEDEVANTYVINLSGGMRALILAVLTAFVISGKTGKIEVELENFKGVISFGPELLREVGLGDYDKKILRSLAKRGKATYKEILKDTGLPRATLFRILKSLRLRGFINTEIIGRTSYYSLTDVGRAYA